MRKMRLFYFAGMVYLGVILGPQQRGMFYEVPVRRMADLQEEGTIYEDITTFSEIFFRPPTDPLMIWPLGDGNYMVSYRGSAFIHNPFEIEGIRTLATGSLVYEQLLEASKETRPRVKHLKAVRDDFFRSLATGPSLEQANAFKAVLKMEKKEWIDTLLKNLSPQELKNADLLSKGVGNLIALIDAYLGTGNDPQNAEPLAVQDGQNPANAIQEENPPQEAQEPAEEPPVADANGIQEENQIQEAHEPVHEPVHEPQNAEPDVLAVQDEENPANATTHAENQAQEVQVPPQEPAGRVLILPGVDQRLHNIVGPGEDGQKQVKIEHIESSGSTRSEGTNTAPSSPVRKDSEESLSS